jgi:hypothetical protein
MVGGERFPSFHSGQAHFSHFRRVRTAAKPNSLATHVWRVAEIVDGGRGEIRTLDFRRVRTALSPLSYPPNNFNNLGNPIFALVTILGLAIVRLLKKGFKVLVPYLAYFLVVFVSV